MQRFTIVETSKLTVLAVFSQQIERISCARIVDGDRFVFAPTEYE